MTTNSISIVNVKINEFDEIEYVEEISENLDENPDNNNSDGNIDIDGDNVLVSTGSNGVMTIKSKNKTIIEHICAKCSKTYKSVKALKRHLNLCRNLPKEDVPETVLCEENEASLMNLSEKDAKDVEAKIKCFCCLENIDTAHSGHIKCNFCPKSFKSHVNLERHLFTLHSATNEFPCNSCNATCPSKEILQLHNEMHTSYKPFSCKTCGKDFTRKYHLERHLNHTGCDKSTPKLQLPCNVCNKMFTRMDNLREHLRAHIGKPTRRKDYQCTFCEKMFYGSSLLNIHLRTHTGERPFPCDLCEKAFPSNGALRKHRRMHTGERPYSCSECFRTFSAKETLNRHRKLHTGDKPHSCKICNRKFIQATQLKSHMFNHTGENGFMCYICQQTFNRKTRLRSHMKSVHNETVTSLSNLKSETVVRQNDNDDDDDVQITTETDEPQFKDSLYKCKVCGFGFDEFDNLVKHMNILHKDVFYDMLIGDSSVPSNDKKENIDVIPDDEDDDDNSLIIVGDDIKMENSNDTQQITSMDDNELEENITKMMKILIGVETLQSFGWPNKSIESVLSLLIEQCGQTPNDYDTCEDYSAKMRENAKLLFIAVLDDNTIKSMLNNHTVDEVIIHVIKSEQ